MNRRVRISLFLAGAAGLAILFAVLICHLPQSGADRDRYLFAVNSTTVPLRNATDAVSAVNFDYRGFDTLGEEFILFASVVGATILLREAEPKDVPLLPDALTPKRDVPASDALGLWVLAMLGAKIVLGVYLVCHGQLTPGGGFQGGVVLATAILVLYLGEGFGPFKKVMPHRWVEIAEGAGAGGFVAIGCLAYLFHREFLTNVLPMGRAGEITAAGTMPLISFTTGIEVAAGFTLLLFAFLQEMLLPEARKDKP